VWGNLTPSDRARLVSTTVLSVALFALALALAYVAYQVGALRQQLPELLASVESTSQKVEPVLHEVDAIRDLIPSILAESKAIRELIPGVVTEVSEVRKALPPLVDTSAKAINNASDAIRTIEPQIPAVLTEVRKTREALPGILDRAERVVTSAQTAGQKAGAGAVQGVLGGIVTAPFKLIGGVGKDLKSMMGFDEHHVFTGADEQLALGATDSVIKQGEVGAKSSWKNPESKNRGSAELVDKWTRDGQSCVTVRHRVEFATASAQTKDIKLCQRPDGQWEAVTPSK
jgi:surface antigen/uncharacterized protein YoxC